MVLLLSIERYFLPRLIVCPLSCVPFSHQNMLSLLAAQGDTSHHKLPESKWSLPPFQTMLLASLLGKTDLLLSGSSQVHLKFINYKYLTLRRFYLMYSLRGGHNQWAYESLDFSAEISKWACLSPRYCDVPRVFLQVATTSWKKLNSCSAYLRPTEQSIAEKSACSSF